MILIAPDAQAGVVVLVNSDAAGASDLASRLLKIVLGVRSDDRREIAVDPSVYESYVGDYEVSSVVISVAKEGNNLFVKMNGKKYEIYPHSVREFFFKTFEAQITFTADDNSHATALVLHEGGTDLLATRVK